MAKTCFSLETPPALKTNFGEEISASGLINVILMLTMAADIIARGIARKVRGGQFS